MRRRLHTPLGLCAPQPPPAHASFACVIRPSCPQLLLDHHASPDARTAGGGLAPLHFSALHGTDHITELLLQARADPNVKVKTVRQRREGGGGCAYGCVWRRGGGTGEGGGGAEGAEEGAGCSRLLADLRSFGDGRAQCHRCICTLAPFIPRPHPLTHKCILLDVKTLRRPSVHVRPFLCNPLPAQPPCCCPAQEASGGNCPLHYAAARSREAQQGRAPGVLALLLQRGKANPDVQNAAGEPGGRSGGGSHGREVGWGREGGSALKRSPHSVSHSHHDVRCKTSCQPALRRTGPPSR